MPANNVPPEVDRIIVGLERRIARLERELGATVDHRLLPALFTFDDLILEFVESPRWRPIYPVELDLITPELGTLGAGDFVVELHLDGALARELTIPDGEHYSQDANPLVVPAGSYLTAIVTTAGGASDLTIGAIPKLLR